MREFILTEAIALLARTPATLDALLRGLPDVWVRGNEGRIKEEGSRDEKDTWSPFDIVGHLIVGERTDWMPRARIILEHGEARPFDPFDRFARLRKENLVALHALNLQPEDMVRRGKHPELGVVTLDQLLATWAVHDLTHLHQISRVMANQYRDAVGPWIAYLGVLHCNGHSA